MTNVQRIVVAAGLIIGALGVMGATRGRSVVDLIGVLLFVGLPTAAVLILTGWQKKGRVEDVEPEEDADTSADN